jgi:uroporphyrinogen decarboxylase
MTLPKLNRKADFTRLRKALLSQGEPDCVPFIELGVHPVWKAKMIGRPCTAVADEIEFARLAGYDFIKLQPGIDMNPSKILPAGGAQTTALTTGDGTRRWADEHSGVINSMEDFERYVWPKPEEITYTRFEDAERLLPPEMGVIGQYGDIYTLVWEQMGFENFAMAIYEDPDLVTALFDKVGGIVHNLYENMVTFPRVQAMWLSDDLAYTGGLMVAPDVFREYLFPWVRKIGDLCESRNIPFLYHSDGVLWDVLDDLIDCGVTALHPIEPKSMDLAEVKERAGGKLAVLGHIEVDTLARGTPEQIEELVKDALRRGAPGGGYAIGSSNSVPEYAKYENYIAMLEAADRWGNYPINL